MLGILKLCVLVTIVTAAPLEEDSQAKIINYENNVDGSGNYDFSFETSNGILRTETGTLMNAGEPDEFILVHGFLRFTDPDGIVHKIKYRADKNGYVILPPTNQADRVQTSFTSHQVATLLG